MDDLQELSMIVFWAIAIFGIIFVINDSIISDKIRENKMQIRKLKKEIDELKQLINGR